ncbi:uncharacterized protein LOC111308028 [Durio zibethinus]|uniref:non-specific serine/threonine protein kinase n=1 Tax=Durio zibethinus TaxID=66656 RepID=A0A6P6ABA2_DURZI|nr:uncharacterized protein LOC111308028 [Durio zibethinus]
MSGICELFHVPQAFSFCFFAKKDFLKTGFKVLGIINNASSSAGKLVVRWRSLQNIMGEKLEFSSGHAEVNPRELGEEIERKRGEYQTNLQPFYRQCKRNELEVKLAAGLCPTEITLKEAQNSNTRWIVLDSHLKNYKLYIYGHVECNVAVMKGKDVATLMPSRAPKPDNSPASCERGDDETCPQNQPRNDQKNGNQNVVEEWESSIAPPPQGCYCCPLQWKVGFPRNFCLSEIEVITNGFADILFENEKVKVYEGVWQNTLVIVRSYQNDQRLCSMLTILSGVSHHNIMNIVGYCCTGKNRFLISNYPCLNNIAMNLQRKIPFSLVSLHFHLLH